MNVTTTDPETDNLDKLLTSSTYSDTTYFYIYANCHCTPTTGSTFAITYHGGMHRT